MFIVQENNIILSRGDTGALTITADGYTFGPNDRALFSVRNQYGTIVIQRAFELTNNAFTMTFFNADTDTQNPGNYTWDVRYVINPSYDDAGNIVDGDQVITPNDPMPFTLKAVVGDI